MVMGDFELIDSLDTLWFFSNVLVPTSQTIVPVLVSEIASTQEEPPPEPVDPNVQTEPPNAESVTVKCPKCGEFAAEVESLQPVETPAIFVDHKEAEISSSRKEGKRRKRRSKRKVLGEIGMGFGVNYYKNCGGFVEETAQTCGFGSEMLPPYEEKMPPLKDGLAMKQHLKSWAYAVACTVR